jgi:signal peptidase II
LSVAYNSGISFSQLSDAGSVVVVLVAAVSTAVAVALFVAPPRYRLALGVILGGALGNLIDRLRYDGAVLDFIGIWKWPSFNVADMAVVFGTLWLAFLLLRDVRT